MSWSRAVFRWRYLSTVVGMLVVVGAGLRLWLLVDASPALLGYPDSGGYIATAATRLSGNVFQPVGYPLFLRLVHLASARLAVTVLVQHVLGLGTALLYVGAVHRVARIEWVALVPALFVLFDGTQLFFEHTVMSEVLLVALLAVAMYAAARVLTDGWLPWTLIMAGALGVAVGVRAVALAAIAVAVLWLAVVRPVPATFGWEADALPTELRPRRRPEAGGPTRCPRTGADHARMCVHRSQATRFIALLALAESRQAHRSAVGVMASRRSSRRRRNRCADICPD